MIIGTFTKTEAGQFDGDIHTFNLQAKISLTPIENPSDKGPHFRAVFQGADLEAGAAWNKTSKEGKPYLSLKLDGPTLDAPIYAALTKTEGDYILNWSRPRPNAEPNGHDHLF